MSTDPSETSENLSSPEYINAPIDLVFILQTTETSLDYFQRKQALIETFCTYAFDTYSDINAYVITFDESTGNILTSSTDSYAFKTANEVKLALNEFLYTYTQDEKSYNFFTSTIGTLFF